MESQCHSLQALGGHQDSQRGGTLGCRIGWGEKRAVPHDLRPDACFWTFPLPGFVPDFLSWNGAGMGWWKEPLGSIVLTMTSLAGTAQALVFLLPHRSPMCCSELTSRWTPVPIPFPHLQGMQQTRTSSLTCCSLRVTGGHRAGAQEARQMWANRRICQEPMSFQCPHHPAPSRPLGKDSSSSIGGCPLEVRRRGRGRL